MPVRNAASMPVTAYHPVEACGSFPARSRPLGVWPGSDRARSSSPSPERSARPSRRHGTPSRTVPWFRLEARRADRARPQPVLSQAGDWRAWSGRWPPRPAPRERSPQAAAGTLKPDRVRGRPVRRLPHAVLDARECHGRLAWARQPGRGQEPGGIPVRLPHRIRPAREAQAKRGDGPLRLCRLRGRRSWRVRLAPVVRERLNEARLPVRPYQVRGVGGLRRQPAVHDGERGHLSEP
jgi:hypothetical protein